MPVNLEDQILKSLRALTAADRPATFNDLARQFGVTQRLAAALGRQLVGQGLAQPYYAMVGGERTLFGLLPQPAGAMSDAQDETLAGGGDLHS